MANNNLPELETINIYELLPQQPPFIMVDNILTFEDDTTSCRYTIQADNIFCDEGLFTESGLIENIAQTCAARLGFYNKYILHHCVQIGYVGAIRNLTIHRLPSVGETIVTTVTVHQNVMGMTLASACVRAKDECIAETEIKIALTEQEEQ